jgi:hypothetical protein
MAAGHVLLAAIAFGLLALLVQALRQNRGLLREVRAGGQPVARLLRDALVVWSPLALAILAAVLAARWSTQAAVAFAYRATPIDQYCRVVGVPGDMVIPCTGMDDRLPAGAVHRAGTPAELEEFLSARFRARRARLVGLTADQLRSAAADRATFLQTLRPRRLLGLPRAPADDPGLARLNLELRALLDHPVPPPTDPLALLRFPVAREARTQELIALTAQSRARRRAVEDAAYAGLPRREQGRLYLRHRVAHALEGIPATLDPGAQAALDRLLARKGDEAADLARVRAGLASVLAQGEIAALQVLEREATQANGTHVLELALAYPRRCTVAHAAVDLRALASGDIALPDDPLATNRGTFACFDDPPRASGYALEPLDFRTSVRRSIDRWHAQALATSTRRLGALARQARSTQVSAQDLARAVPRGIDLGRDDCGLLHPLGCGANALRHATEQSLAGAFADVAEPLEHGASSVAQGAEDVDARAAQLLATIDERFARLRRAAHVEADRLFLAADLFRLLGWLTLALVVLKSFLYVLALEVFHHEGELTFGLETGSTIEGEVRAGRQLTIDREFPRPLITRKQLSNTDNDVRLAPWPFSSPLGRILRGRYFLFTRGTFLADAERPARGMVASASGGMAIVEWKMRPGEQVVFAYRDFFGASDNVRLRSEISLRLSTLLLGRIIFRIAHCGEGEGRLLLRAHVEETDPEHIRAIPPERLLAWSRHARFAIHSARTPWKTLLNGYTLVRKDRPGRPDGLVVVSSEDAGSNLGSIRFVRRFFSALF